MSEYKDTTEAKTEYASEGRITAAIFAGMGCGGIVALSGFPLMGHVVDVIVFCAVLMFRRRSQQ